MDCNELADIMWRFIVETLHLTWYQQVRLLAVARAAGSAQLDPCQAGAQETVAVRWCTCWQRQVVGCGIAADQAKACPGFRCVAHIGRAWLRCGCCCECAEESGCGCAQVSYAAYRVRQVVAEMFVSCCW